MIIISFIIMLLATIVATNKKNNANGSSDTLEFEKKDSAIIFLCFLLSIAIELMSEKYFHKDYYTILAASSGLFLMTLIITNVNREKNINKKHDQILKILQALSDIFGKVTEIDFSKVPFEMKEDPKTHLINEISIDTSQDGRFNENTITLAQYSINKFFPDLQWISKMDYPKRLLTFRGLPKPPTIAKFPGSDYRPTEWIPLGLNGEGEIGWNIAAPKDLGSSSFVTDDGVIPNAVMLPSSPQCLTLGSTGGGKAIWVNQEVDIVSTETKARKRVKQFN